jgi:hypothetical protein
VRLLGEVKAALASNASMANSFPVKEIELDILFRWRLSNASRGYESSASLTAFVRQEVPDTVIMPLYMSMVRLSPSILLAVIIYIRFWCLKAAVTTSPLLSILYQEQPHLIPLIQNHFI